MPHRLNELGFMVDPDFHDGYLTGISTSGKTVELVMQHLSGQSFRLRIEDVENLQADDFKLGNIVMDVRLITGWRPSENDLLLLYPNPHPEVPRHALEKHKGFLKKQLDKIEGRETILLQVSSSYGCNLTAICGRVEVIPLKLASL